MCGRFKLKVDLGAPEAGLSHSFSQAPQDSMPRRLTHFFLVNENVIESIKMKGGAHACGVKK